MKQFIKYPKSYIASATNAVFGIAVYFEGKLLGYVESIPPALINKYQVFVNENPADASHYPIEAPAQQRMKYLMSRCQEIKVFSDYSIEAPPRIYKLDHRISMKVEPIVELPASGAGASDESGRWVIAMYVSGQLKGYVYSHPVGEIGSSKYSRSWLNVVPDIAEAEIYEDPSNLVRWLNRYKNFHCIRVYNDAPPTSSTSYETWTSNVDVDDTQGGIFKIDSRIEFKIESLDNNDGKSITFM